MQGCSPYVILIVEEPRFLWGEPHPPTLLFNIAEVFRVFTYVVTNPLPNHFLSLFNHTIYILIVYIHT